MAESTVGGGSENVGGQPGPSGPSGDLRERVIEVLKTCFDPEIPVNIYELGLVYSVDVNPPADVSIRMTLTSPACPVAGSLPPEVEQKVRSIPGVTDARVELVWEPPWSPNMMTEAAKLQLGFL
jgi:FeS assembly SUF system protein